MRFFKKTQEFLNRLENKSLIFLARQFKCLKDLIQKLKRLKKAHTPCRKSLFASRENEGNKRDIFTTFKQKPLSETDQKVLESLSLVHYLCMYKSKAKNL